MHALARLAAGSLPNGGAVPGLAEACTNGQQASGGGAVHSPYFHPLGLLAVREGTPPPRIPIRNVLKKPEAGGPHAAGGQPSPALRRSPDMK